MCDNTRTCRAAGYSAEGSDAPVSVLFARASGPGRPRRRRTAAGHDGRAQRASGQRRSWPIGGKPAGTIRDRSRTTTRALAPAVVAALLKAPWSAGSRVAFTAGKTTWRLSGDGAVDVLQQDGRGAGPHRPAVGARAQGHAAASRRAPRRWPCRASRRCAFAPRRSRATRRWPCACSPRIQQHRRLPAAGRRHRAGRRRGCGTSTPTGCW